MTKGEALYQFFSGFGMTAYPASSIPDDVTYPWIDYSNVIGNTGEAVAITANLWYHTDSEAVPNAKAEEISSKIGRGGCILSYDDGSIWVKRGTPWSTAMTDQNDPAVKGRSLNITLEFM